MTARGLVLLLLVTALLPARGQDDGPIKMTPEYALAVPLVQAGHDVTVRFPVLINRTTVLTPGMVLRNLYLPPTPGDSEDLALAHQGDMEEAYSRPAPSSDDQPKMPPEIAHELEHQRRIVWEVPINFQLAMAQLPTDRLHLIYSPTGDHRQLRDVRLGFYDGLLLGSPTPGVTVLAVEKGSKADRAGFKPGDKILAVGALPVPDDLAAFPQVYFGAKESARDDRAPTLAFVVRSAPRAETQTLHVAMPPTIKSQLMEGFR